MFGFARSLIALSLVTSLAAQAVTPARPLELRAADANNAFAVDLFRDLRRLNPGQNIVYSPVSAHLALSLAMEGTNAETRAEFAKVLKVDAPAPLSRALLASLQADKPGFKLALANSLWTRREVALRESYRQQASFSFGATAQSLDFENPESASKINDWVSRKTNGKITQITDAQALRKSDFLLLNAAYFNATWTHPFAADSTHEAEFHVTTESQQKVSMMSHEGKFRHIENASGEGIELDYGSDASASFIVWMPRETSAAFSSRDIQSVTQAELSLGSLELPKFELKTKYMLNESLQSLGLRTAFSDRADFSRMSNQRQLLISQVLQKVFIRVDEKGTEAAAVTSVGIRAAAVFEGPTPAFHMVVDRPFYFVIRDKQTGAYLFMGRIESPNAL